MTEIFLYIVNMSITATILAVVVLLLRLLLKKAPKWISVLLWGLVAIRLICPYAVESSFSLMPKTDWVVQEPLTEEDLFLNSVPDTIPAFDSSSFGSDITVQYSYYPLENSNIEIHRGISVSFILSCIWAAGMAALLLHTVISTIRLHKSIGAAIRIQDNVWESSAVESPFVLGMIRPRIYVPRGMSEEKLTYVIAHEEAHIRRKDHWWKPLGFLLLTVHWFNPVIWLAYILLCRDIEMACDEKVVRDMGEVERADYSEALLECSVKRTMISACPLAFGEVGVKTRIKSVLSYKKPAFWIVIVAVVACIVSAVCFLTNPMSKTAISIDEHDWYFKRVFITDLEKNSIEEEYQRGLNPKTENAEPVNVVLVPDGEPMWYQFITGDWDTERIGLHFIPEKTDSRNARYTVELYRDTGELYQGADAVMEPMTDGDGYVLTVYFTRDGYENQLIFTTEKQPGAAQGKKKLTLDDVITLSEKQMALTWEDFAEYTYTDAGTWNFRCIYEIDEIFWLEITGGSMHGTPMQINLCAKADYGDGAEYIDIRRRYADEYIVEAFIEKHKNPQSLLFGTPVEWFYETAWEIAQQTAQEHGIVLDKNNRDIFYSENGEYVGVEFYDSDRIKHSRIAFFRDENGNYSTQPVNQTAGSPESITESDPVMEYQYDIIEQAAESIFGAVTVYASGIDKLEKISTGTVGLSEEILLYRLDYWITKGINGLAGTPSEEIWRETVYFAMFHDWTSDTWTRLGTITEAEIDEKYDTMEMISKYGNKYTAAACEMKQEYYELVRETPVKFTAVITEFDPAYYEHGMMSLNIVEFITRDDTERIAELVLSEMDMISGYYIHDEDQSITTLRLPADTEFIFYDWRDAYTDEADERYEILGERWISTRDAELFCEYWLPYKDAGTPGYPFAFTASEESVVIREIPLM